MSLINIENLTYKNILKDINISIEENTFVTISGCNMSGKTTLIKLLSNLLDSNNKIFLENKKISRINSNTFHKKVAYVIPSLKENFIFETVEKELMFILDNLGYKKGVKLSRYKEMIKLFSLEEVTQLFPDSLSNNLKIKLLLAIAVVSKPKVLLLDDICSTMNKEETKKIVSILKALQKGYNLTIVMTTSNLDETVLSDYLYILDKGEIVMKDKPLKILKKDNKLNKLGLNIPFMIDLCVKLEDYNVINRIVMDMDLLVSALWK